MQNNNLKKNIIYSYISQIYLIVCNIMVLPLYIKFLGVELYGLVGFFMLLQSMLTLMDIGLTSTLTRETAKLRAGTNNEVEYLKIYISVGIVFFLLVFSGCFILYFSADIIAQKWLNSEKLNYDDIVYSIKIMAFCIGFRLLGSLQKSVIIGNEMISWISVFNIISMTFKNGVVFFVLFLLGSNAKVFFGFQLVVSISEFVMLIVKSTKLLPIGDRTKDKIKLSIKPIKPHLAFVFSSALSSSLWVMVTQADKILMSKILSLKEFGYFTLAVSISSTITLISGPIHSSMTPRMTILLSNGKAEEFKLIYRKATHLVAVLAGSISIFLVFFSENIVYLWTGQKDMVENVAPLIKLYAIGYGITIFGSLPYLVQYSFGNLKLHLLGTLLFLIVMLCTLYFLTSKYQVLGAGYAWVLTNLIYFLLWPMLVHSKFMPSFHLNWILKDIITIITTPIIVAFLISRYIVFSDLRISVFFELSVIGLIIFFCSLINSVFLRKYFFLYINEIRKRLY